MGVAKAKEALLWGKKLTADELRDCGFVKYVLVHYTAIVSSSHHHRYSTIFPATTDTEFHSLVRNHVLSELDNLDPTAILASKRLLQNALRERNDPDAINLRESYSQAQRFASGIPSERFQKIANKEIRHKL